MICVVCAVNIVVKATKAKIDVSTSKAANGGGIFQDFYFPRHTSYIIQRKSLFGIPTRKSDTADTTDTVDRTNTPHDNHVPVVESSAHDSENTSASAADGDMELGPAQGNVTTPATDSIFVATTAIKSRKIIRLNGKRSKFRTKLIIIASFGCACGC